MRVGTGKLLGAGLAIIAIGISAPPAFSINLCTLTGNLTSIAGAPAANTRVYFKSLRRPQSVGGTVIPFSAFSVVTDSSGNLPASPAVTVPQGAYALVTVGDGQPVQMQIPLAASADLSTLLLANSDPPSLLSTLNIGAGGDFGLAVTNPGAGAVGTATLQPGRVTSLQGVPVAAAVANPGQFLVQNSSATSWVPTSITGDIAASVSTPGQFSVASLSGVSSPISLVGSGAGGGDVIANVNVNGVLNVKSYGASGSLQNTTASTTAGSSAVALAAALDFKVGQGVVIAHGQTSCTDFGEPCPAGPSPTASLMTNFSSFINLSAQSTTVYAASGYYVGTGITPGSVHVHVQDQTDFYNDTAISGTDNGSGGFTGAGIASGSISYSNGAVSLTFSTALARPTLVWISFTYGETRTASFSYVVVPRYSSGGIGKVTAPAAALSNVPYDPTSHLLINAGPFFNQVMSNAVVVDWIPIPGAVDYGVYRSINGAPYQLLAVTAGIPDQRNGGANSPSNFYFTDWGHWYDPAYQDPYAQAARQPNDNLELHSPSFPLTLNASTYAPLNNNLTDDLVTSIANISGTAVTLAATAGITGTEPFWHEDSAAIQAALNAAAGKGYEVYLPSAGSGSGYNIWKSLVVFGATFLAGTSHNRGEFNGTINTGSVLFSWGPNPTVVMAGPMQGDQGPYAPSNLYIYAANPDTSASGSVGSSVSNVVFESARENGGAHLLELSSQMVKVEDCSFTYRDYGVLRALPNGEFPPGVADYHHPLAPSWAPSTGYAFGARVQPAAPNGYYYIALVAGTSGSATPAWPTAYNATITDGAVTWMNFGQASNSQYMTGGHDFLSHSDINHNSFYGQAIRFIEDFEFGGYFNTISDNETRASNWSGFGLETGYVFDGYTIVNNLVEGNYAPDVTSFLSPYGLATSMMYIQSCSSCVIDANKLFGGIGLNTYGISGNGTAAHIEGNDVEALANGINAAFDHSTIRGNILSPQPGGAGINVNPSASLDSDIENNTATNLAGSNGAFTVIGLGNGVNTTRIMGRGGLQEPIHAISAPSGGNYVLQSSDRFLQVACGGELVNILLPGLTGDVMDGLTVTIEKMDAANQGGLRITAPAAILGVPEQNATGVAWFGNNTVEISNQYAEATLQYNNGSWTLLAAQQGIPNPIGGVTSGSTITCYFGESNVCTFTLSQNATLAFNGALAGNEYRIRITGTGTAYTLTWPPGTHWPGGTPPTPTSTTGHWDEYHCDVDAGPSYTCSVVQNFQ